MSPTLQAGPEVLETLDPTLLPVSLTVLFLWSRRWLIVGAGLGCLVLGFLVSLLMQNVYVSEATLMPPDAQTLNAQSALTGGGLPISLGGVTSQRTPGSTVIGIMKSRTVADHLVDRFDLRHRYGVKLYQSARDELAADSVFDEDKKSGIVTITVSAHDKVLARDIAQAYVDDVDRLLNTLNSSSARQERIFLESRLLSLKQELDQTTQELSKFASKNVTMNPQGQEEQLFVAATKLQSALGEAEADLSGLRATYSEDNARVRAARARAATLRSQLQTMGGLPTGSGPGARAANEVYPSIRELPLLGVQFSDLYRRQITQQAVYETLTKQYEMAKVSEAKELPVARELDAPVVAETKTSPRRAMIALTCGLLGAVLAILSLVAQRYLLLAETRYGFKSFMKRLRRASMPA